MKSETFRANVRFLSWEGGRPPKEYYAKNVKVIRSGKRYTIHLDNGLIFIKMAGSYGTYIERIKEA